jgi:SMC interacting uncharacterized protein involved in chromosome segregation
MRRLWILMAAVVAFGGLAVFSPAAGAASKPSPQFCQAVTQIGDVQSGDTPTGDQARATAKGFKSAAKYAPRKVKSAMNTIGNYINQFADVKSVKDVTSLDPGKLKGYSQAIQTYIKYYLQCSLNDLSGTTTTSG